MTKEELRVIPKRNYVILAIILLISFLLIYYFYMWIDAYNETKLNKPILDKYLEVINYNELEDYIIESPNAIIYISVLENSEIRDFEKQFKNMLKTDQINEDLLYMDITDEMNNERIKKEIGDSRLLSNINIQKLPTVIVIDNGNVTYTYSVSENNFDIQDFKMFVNNIKFSSEGEING